MNSTFAEIGDKDFWQKNKFLVIKDIQKSSPDRHTSYLSQAEISVLETKNRKLEWLTGRLAAKESLSKYLDLKSLPRNKPGDISVLSKNSGVPTFYLGKENLDLHLSISHSGDLAVANVCDSSGYLGIGVDIETVRDFKTRIVQSFMTGLEFSYYLDQDKETKNVFATVIWSTKESVLKALGSGLKIQPGRISLEFDKQRLAVSSVRLDDKKIELETSWTTHDDFYIMASTKLLIT